MGVFQSDAFLLCLLASILWAPIIYLAATLLDRGKPLKVSHMIWCAALAAAILPSLLAPAFSSAGFSLRPPAEEEIKTLPVIAAETKAGPVLKQQDNAVPAATPVHPGQPIFRAADSVDKTATSIAATNPFFSIPSLSSVTNIVGLLYVYGAILAFGLWLFKTAGFAFTNLNARDVTDPALLREVDEWRRRFGVRRKIRVKESPNVSTVCVSGLTVPVILIPQNIYDRVQLRDIVMMCAHEVAHVKRGDVLLFSFSAIVRIVFWFNPFIKRITSQVELAAEQCADALVVTRGANRRDYAACFVEGLKYAAKSSASSYAALPSFTPLDRKGRRKRLEMILRSSAGSHRSGLDIFTLLVAAMVTSVGVFAQAGLAAQPREKLPKSIAPSQISKILAAPAPSTKPISSAKAASLSPKISPKFAGSLSKIPVEGKVTAKFGATGPLWTDKKTGTKKVAHKGIDIAAPLGTKIIAPGKGIVVEATDIYGGGEAWGKVIIIDHGDGLTTRYAHLDSFSVAKNDRVWAGDVIGKVGSTGRSTGPHLHFETLVDGVNVDPFSVLNTKALNQDYPAKIRKGSLAPGKNAKPAPALAPVPAFAPAPALTSAPALIPAQARVTTPATTAPQSLSNLDLAGADKGIVIVDATGIALDDLDDFLDTIADVSDVAGDLSEEIAEAIIDEFDQNSEIRFVDATGRSLNRAMTAERHAFTEKSIERMSERIAQAEKLRKKDLKLYSEKVSDAYAAFFDENQGFFQQQNFWSDEAFENDFDHDQDFAGLAGEDDTYSSRRKSRALATQERQLKNAHRSIQHAQRELERSLDQAKRGLQQSERSLENAQLSKKDLKKIKKEFSRALDIMNAQKEEQLDALRRAEKSIELQQKEISRLKKQLAKS